MVDSSKDMNVYSNNLNHKFIKFSPKGNILSVHEQNKQLSLYIRSNCNYTEVIWQLKQIIRVGKSISALDLTGEFLFIAVEDGDIYQIDLSLIFNNNNFNNNDFIVTNEHCIVKYSSIVLDICFMRINDKSFILTADQHGEICLIDYQNSTRKERYCLGHTEFVSQVKLIDNNHILSASGDGKCLF